LKIGKATELWPKAGHHDQVGGQASHPELNSDLKPARNPRRGLLGHFGVIVQEPKCAVGDGDHEHDPNEGISEIAPDQRPDDQARQDHKAAHGGRADLFDDVPLNAVAADRLAATLLFADPVDEAIAHQPHHRLSREQRRACAEGEVAE
jgi:hypothetical protein